MVTHIEGRVGRNSDDLPVIQHQKTIQREFRPTKTTDYNIPYSCNNENNCKIGRFSKDKTGKKHRKIVVQRRDYGVL